MPLISSQRDVLRYFIRGQFSAKSSKQVLNYIKLTGHNPGVHKKTRRPTAEKGVIERLAHKTGDPIFGATLRLRRLDKLDGTYVTGFLNRLDESNRIHTTFTHRPASMRLSSVNPNIENILDGDPLSGSLEERLACDFHRSFEAAPGCKLVSADYDGIEAVQTGWFMGDPNYIRLSKLGIHSLVALRMMGQDVDLAQSDADLLSLFKEVKKKHGAIRDKAKRTVHRCLTPDHEVLTPFGWTRLDQLGDGTLVAQWWPGDYVDFVKPSAIIKERFCGRALNEFSGRAFHIKATANHRFPTISSSSGRVIARAASHFTPSSRIPLVGTLEGYKHGSAEWVRLGVAIQADANVTKHRALFHLVKPRKMKRLLGLLAQLHVPYQTRPCKCHVGGRRIWMKLVDIVPALELLEPEESASAYEKRFSLPLLLQYAVSARKIFLDELPLWDGRVSNGESGRQTLYRTTSEHNARVVQTVAHVTGREAMVRVSVRGDWKPVYRISFNRRTFAHTQRLRRRRVKYSGNVWCLTVPSSYFLIRYKGAISVTGNSNYGSTPRGIQRDDPEMFPTVREAEEIAAAYDAVAPMLRPWQLAICERAAKEERLGGPGDHPFGFWRWFYDIHHYDSISAEQYARRLAQGEPSTKIEGRYYAIRYGRDAEKAMAFYPSSTAAGIILDDMLELFDPEEGSPHCIHDLYYGQTPLRNQIHDQLILEVPDRQVDRAVESMRAVMQTPVLQQPCPAEWGFGSHLKLTVTIKVGQVWDDETMEEVAV